MGRALVLAVLCLVGSAPAYAGYYAYVTSTTGSSATGTACSAYLGAGPSQCYLTPSMAMHSLKLGYTMYINSAGTNLAGDSISGYVYNSAQCAFEAQFRPCTAAPASFALPVFNGSATDPAFTSDGLNTGGTGTGGGSTVTLEVPAITPLSPDVAIEDAVSIFGLGFLFLSSVWGLRRLYDLFARDTA